MRKCWIILSILLPCLNLSSQNELEKEKLAREYIDKGLELRYTEKDSSYYYFELAAEYYLEEENYSKALDILLESIFASGINYDLKKYRYHLDKMQVILKDNSNKMTPKDAEFYENRFIYEEGSYLIELKKYSQAKSKFQELYDIYSKKDVEKLDINDLSFLIYSTNLLASIFMDLGKNDLAESYFKKALTVVEKNTLAEEQGFARSTNRLLAQLYINMGKHESADVILKDLLESYTELYANDKEYKNSLVVVYQRMVKNLFKQDNLLRALEYLDESQKYLLNEDPFYKESLLLYGDIYMKLNQEQQALEHYKSALEFFKEYRQQKPHQDIAEVQGKIAELHLKQENHQEGLRMVQKAFNAAGNNINIKKTYTNPRAEEVFSKRQLLQLLDIKLQLLEIAHNKTGEKQYLDAAIQANGDILRTFDLLKKEFESKLDKQFLAETAYPIFHRMLAITYDAYENNPDPKLFELALNISEKNKDFLLLEALRNANATEYGSIPKKVIEKEAQLRAEISNTEKNLFESTDEKSVYSEELFELKQEYYGFLDILESKYPKYHDLKYQSSTLNLATVRRALENNEVLISFTMTGDHLYALISDANTEDFLRLPFEEADRESVREFYRLISSPTIKDNNQVISELATNLYEKILKLPLANFESENLTIISDDVLHYLPFDLLEKDKELLLQSKFIGYGNSISSYLELKAKQKGKVENLLAFAPSFSGAVVPNSERQFGKLLYNNDEVKRIGSVFESEIYSEENATLENFKTIAPEFDVIHLATHASANDEYPDYSYLAFSEEEGDSNVLYIKDLYNTTLNANMVTLSACQTGIGKLQKGQGMMSLSKGFFYAGAKSLVNTLWKINDKSSVKLMEYFYEGLSRGKNKKEALRDAKLKYLATTDDSLLKHPYYWSAFVISGDIAPITNTYNWWYFGAGAVLIALFMAFFISKGKEKLYRLLK